MVQLALRQLDVPPGQKVLPLKEIIPQYLQDSKTAGRNAIMKAFRRWVAVAKR